MSVATWVTISVITIPSGSSAKERSTFKEPLCHIVQRRSSKKRSCAGLANMVQKAVFSAAPSSGKKGISHSQGIWTACATASPAPAAARPAPCAAGSACWASAARSGKVMSSLAQEVGLFHVDGAERLVDGQHDGEPHRGLGRRQHDHEDAEDLPGQLPRPLHEVVERDEVHVRGVEDQLHPHQDADRVAPRDHRDHAEREKDRADDEEMGQADRGHRTVSLVSLISLRAITTEPISAASRTTEAISKGSR